MHTNVEKMEKAKKTQTKQHGKNYKHKNVYYIYDSNLSHTVSDTATYFDGDTGL